MAVQKTVYSIIIITIVIAILLLFVNSRLKKFDPLSKPKGLVLLMIMFYDFLANIITDATGDQKMIDFIEPYFMSVITYIFIANIAGLFALECPTSNYSVTLTLAAITCILIEVVSFRSRGGKAYLKAWFEPFAPFLVMNLISKFSTLLSLSLRLFGNILGGGILMSVIYQLLAKISAVVPFIGQFNFVAVLIAPALHFYFDLFAGAIQAFLFTNLSIRFIGNELPRD